ncbi:hypothetical protein M011DRAFT_10459 [Sporormia fimetaria CBS 119925]|uniref:Uncharacterized protein n=1 Tax=Sporormia fimetaria CBS 119925 TaxID=1340428 RepID=A0A6A6VP51_9PLEO|nr:hypothetical protein M011DRAFT_10459 [Sporormia fimetaria CBS 119925]
MTPNQHFSACVIHQKRSIEFSFALHRYTHDVLVFYFRRPDHHHSTQQLGHYFYIRQHRRSTTTLFIIHELNQHYWGLGTLPQKSPSFVWKKKAVLHSLITTITSCLTFLVHVFCMFSLG